jgi:hypothetical protein
MAAFQGAMSPQEQIREMNRMRAITRNNKFITLILKDERKRNAIFGIEVINATPFINDQKGGVQDFIIEIKGGSLEFVWDMGEGEFIAKMLDSKHNRAFLASHYYGRTEKDGTHFPYWEIKDSDVDAEIREMADSIKATMIKPEQTVNYKMPEEKERKPQGFLKKFSDAVVEATSTGKPTEVPNFVQQRTGVNKP